MDIAPQAEGLRSRKKRQMREKLIVTARNLFAERGFDATTIEAIAEIAGVSKPTVFNYFPSKRALLHELAHQADMIFAEIIQQLSATSLPVARQLEKFFMNVADLMEREPSLTRVLMVEAVKAMSEEEGTVAHHRFARAEKAVTKLLRDGIRRGEVRTDYSAVLMAQMIMGSYTNILLMWLAVPGYNMRARLKESARFLGEAIQPK